MKRDPHIRPWTPRTISGTGGNAAGGTGSGSGSTGRRQEYPPPLRSVILEGPTVGGVLPVELTRFSIIDRRLRNAEPLARAAQRVLQERVKDITRYGCVLKDSGTHVLLEALVGSSMRYSADPRISMLPSTIPSPEMRLRGPHGDR
jgi:hypothetical protein